MTTFDKCAAAGRQARRKAHKAYVKGAGIHDICRWMLGQQFSLIKQVGNWLREDPMNPAAVENAIVLVKGQLRAWKDNVYHQHARRVGMIRQHTEVLVWLRFYRRRLHAERDHQRGMNAFQRSLVP